MAAPVQLKLRFGSIEADASVQWLRRFKVDLTLNPLTINH